MSGGSLIPIEFAELYDGTGRHLGGLYPPLMVGNLLTQALYDSKAPRPITQKLFRPELLTEVGMIEPELGLVWMLPLGMQSAAEMPSEVLAELVHEMDAGRMVMLHADTAQAVHCVAVWVVACAGGGACVGWRLSPRSFVALCQPILRRAAEPMTTRDIALVDDAGDTHALDKYDLKLLELITKRVDVARRTRREGETLQSDVSSEPSLLTKLCHSACDAYPGSRCAP